MPPILFCRLLRQLGRSKLPLPSPPPPDQPLRPRFIKTIVQVQENEIIIIKKRNKKEKEKGKGKKLHPMCAYIHTIRTYIILHIIIHIPCRHFCIYTLHIYIPTCLSFVSGPGEKKPIPTYLHIHIPIPIPYVILYYIILRTYIHTCHITMYGVE